MAAQPDIGSEVNPALSEFLLSFIQAFLKTGYYTSDHPEANKARRGLYDSLHNFLQGKKEFTFFVAAEAGKQEVFLSGLSSELVPLSSLMTRSMADLFLPKFIEYFERKRLSSFSLKAGITVPEFEKFISIMTESPLAGEKETDVREKLSMDLIQNEILMVSTVFNVDLVGKGRKLPWRVEVSLSRLKKDLTMVPLYRNLPPEKVSALKQMIFEDIIRPINSPRVIKEMMVNLDLISGDLLGITPEELGAKIIEQFSDPLLFGVTGELLDNLDDLRKAFSKIQDVEMLVRMEYLKSITRSLFEAMNSRKVFDEDMFSRLLSSRVVSAEEVPAFVRQRAMRAIARETFVQSPDRFYEELAAVSDPTERQDRITLLFEFVAELFEKGRYDELTRLFAVTGRHGVTFDETKEADLFTAIVSAVNSRAATAAREEQAKLLAALTPMGRTGTHLLVSLLDNRSRVIRRSVIDALVARGLFMIPFLLTWIEQKEGWYFLRNAIHVLARMGFGGPEIEQILRQGLTHTEPNVRKEAIQGVVSLLKEQSGQLLTPLLRDPNPEIRKKTIAALTTVRSTEPEFLKALVGAIINRRDDDLFPIALQAVSEMGLPAGHAVPVEAALVRILKDSSSVSGFLRKMTQTQPQEKALVLKALAAIGNAESAKLIARFLRDKSPVVEKSAAEAIAGMKKRGIRTPE